MSELVHVAAAVITDGDERILLAKRKAEQHQGGLWEFPGGKVEGDESVEEALVREIEEEVGLTPQRFRRLITLPYHYPDRSVLLDVWYVDAFKGVAHGAEGQEIRWVQRMQLGEYAFPEANGPIIMAAQLPDTYLITPEPPGKEAWPAYLSRLETLLAEGISLLQLRAKTLPPEQYAELAGEVAAVCRRHRARLLLNGHPELVGRVASAGLHLTSQQLHDYTIRPVSTEYLLAASCHTREDLQQAVKIGVDFAVLGPVCKTATHPDAEAIGWDGFAELASSAGLPVYALGGVARSDRADAWKAGAQGVAAIRSLWNQ